MLADLNLNVPFIYVHSLYVRFSGDGMRTAETEQIGPIHNASGLRPAPPPAQTTSLVIRPSPKAPRQTVRQEWHRRRVHLIQRRIPKIRDRTLGWCKLVDSEHRRRASQPAWQGSWPVPPV